MRILIVGGNKSWWAIERYYITHLKELGAEVYVYAAPDIIFDYHSKNILNKILFKSKIKTGYKSVSAGLIDKANAIRPDVIWVFKGMEIYPSTLEYLKKHYILVNYNPDHPFMFVGAGSGNKNVTDSVRHYHLHFCYNSMVQKQIEEQYQIPCVFLPFGYELTGREYDGAAAEQEIKRVCFIGNPDDIRESTLQYVAQNGWEVDVYGGGWNRRALKTAAHVTVHDSVTGEAFWKKIRSYRVQLNIFRKHNDRSHNMRSFEIPAAGGIQLAPDSPEHRTFFTEGREIFLYKNEEEMLLKIEQLMKCPEAEIHDLRRAARERSIESGYSYADRAMTVYKTFEQLIGG